MVFKAVLLHTGLVASLTLSSPPASLHQPSNESAITVLLEQPLHNGTHSRTSSLGKPFTVCDEKLGSHLDVGSCEEIFERLGNSTGAETWGPRGAGQFSQTLPQKTISTDGTCWASPFLVPGKSHAVASKKDFGEAFSEVLVDCVLINGGLGGSGRDIGGDNNLEVFVGEFNPKEISCNHDSLPGSDFEASCQSILNSMPYDKVDRWFGGQVQGHVMLPKTFTSYDGLCDLTIRSTGADWYSWEEIWDQAVNVVGMCARQGRKGTASPLGRDSKIRLELGRGSSPLVSSS